MNKMKLPYFLVLPAMFLLFMLVIFPTIYLFYTSVHEADWTTGYGIGKFVGLKNYYDLMKNPDFLGILKRTFLFVLMTVGMGFFVALNSITKGERILLTVFLLPWMTSGVVSSVMWSWIYNDLYGVLNDLLVRMNLISQPISWLGNASTALFACTVVDIWALTPFGILILTAGLKSIPGPLYEAAKVDGAGTLLCFRYITLPLLIPSILMVILIRTIFAIRAFDIFYVLTGGGPGKSTTVAGLAIYNYAWKMLKFGRASAFSVIIIFITLAIAWIYIKMSNVRFE